MANLIIIVFGGIIALAILVMLIMAWRDRGGSGGGGVHKPIIYLYPQQEKEIHVELDYSGELTTTYPKYNPEKGWTVVAQPDGTLLSKDTQKEYYGLYWEGEGPYSFDLSTGFVVKGEASAAFLDEKLAQLGLTRREANEFIVYWLPQLEENKYNLIHFAQKEYQDLAKLYINPQPETLIRVFMVYKPLGMAQKLPAQEFPKVERKGFTVVEWGGTKIESRSILK